MESALETILDNWVTAILALVVCVVFYVYIQWMHMPSGPMGLPYLGYYPFLGRDFHLQLHDLTKKYGDVFCIRSTGQLLVYLGSTQAIREAHVTKSDCFSARPQRFSTMTDCFGSGVVFLTGEEWKDMRKFAVQKLKEFGFGKRTQECLLEEFLEKTVNTIRKTNGEDFDALSFFTSISSRIIYSMLISGSKVEDSDIKTFNEAYAIITEAMVGSRMLLSGPLLRLMVHLHPEFRRYRKSKFLLDDMLANIVKEHEKDFNKENIRDFVDCYINMRRELEEKGDRRSKTYTAKALADSLMQFLGDGGFSVGFVIAMLLKAVHTRPEIQKEVQREIDSIVGRNRFPSWDDRSRMPYTNAVIQECFRTVTFFPAFTSLECTKETTIGDCRVPKGAVTLVGYWASFQDPEVYQEPEKFDPTRFLSNDDQQKPKADLPLFFGIGKRSCIGESLVTMETFLFITTVLQNFDLHPLKENESGKADLPQLQPVDEYSVVFRAIPRAS